MGKDLHPPQIKQMTDLQIYKELKKLGIKIVKINKKLGYRTKQRILNRRISNGQKILKKCSIFLSIKKFKSKSFCDKF